MAGTEAMTLRTSWMLFKPPVEPEKPMRRLVGATKLNAWLVSNGVTVAPSTPSPTETR
ncbi:hypothetical protein D3C71_2244640 [compost metagenome]